MIVSTEFMVREDGVRLVQRVSDRGVMLRKVGTDEMYSDPVDVENAPWSYEETDIPVDTFETPETPENPFDTTEATQ